MCDTISDDDDYKGDILTDDGRTLSNRTRVKDMLAEIAQRVKRELADAEIEIGNLFFLIPNSGMSLLIFGTDADPCDKLWSRATEVVISVVQDLLGIEQLKARTVACAAA